MSQKPFNPIPSCREDAGHGKLHAIPAETITRSVEKRFPVLVQQQAIAVGSWHDGMKHIYGIVLSERVTAILRDQRKEFPEYIAGAALNLWSVRLPVYCFPVCLIGSVLIMNTIYAPHDLLGEFSAPPANVLPSCHAEEALGG